MLAYSYLKANPQLRDAQLKYNWHELFTSSDTPFSVKQELLDIQKVVSEPTDAQLYWHQELLMHALLEDMPVHKLDPCVFNSHWIEDLYLIATKLGSVNQCRRLLICLESNLVDIYLTQAELFKLINVAAEYSIFDNVYKAILLVITNINRASELVQFNNGELQVLFNYCDERLIRKIQNVRQLQSILEMLNDITYTDQKFKFINEIEKLHDEQAEQQAKEVAKKHSNKWYEYTSELIEIVKDTGFTLPNGPGDLVARGQKHHNCVANYDGQHRRRACIFFTKTATLELDYDCHNTIICGTRLKQFKGAYNRNAELTDGLLKLRLGFCGKDINILEVKTHESADQIETAQ